MKYVVLIAATALASGCAATRPPADNVGPGNACHPATEEQIAGLFERWNQSLQTGDPNQVVANYAEVSTLLPTLSNKPRLTEADKHDYFQHFLANQPSGRIDSRMIEVGCNYALDTGLYTFTFATSGEVVGARYTFTYRWDGNQWLITSHHSSLMPSPL